MSKTLNGTYLFSSYPQYQKDMIDFVINGERIDKSNSSFEEVKSTIKRCRLSSSLTKLLDSKNIVLIVANKEMSKSLKVFTAKDIKGGGTTLKTFIDCTGIIDTEKGIYSIHNTDSADRLVAYLLDAMMSHIYFADEKIVTMNTTLTKTGTEAFAKLFTHIIDYIGKISIVSGSRDKCEYMAAMYFQANILGKDEESDAVRNTALKISGISEKEQDIIDIQLIDGAYTNLKLFIESVSKILKVDKLNVNIFVEKWMYLYGPGTVFALEFYPSFSAMLTDAYVGCYINNQKTIEKVADDSMVDYTKCVLEIGANKI